MQQNINRTYIAGQTPNFEAYQNPQLSSGAQRIEDNTLMKQAEKTKDNPLVLVGGTVGFGAGLLWLTNLLNQQLRGDYDKTFFGKMEKWGNDIGSKKAVSAAGEKAHGLGSWIKTNIVNKSEVLRSMWNKPSMGGDMVQGQAAGTLGHLTNSTREFMELYDKNHGTEIFKDILAKTAKDPHKYSKEIKAALKAHPEALNEVMYSKDKWLKLPKFLKKGNTLGELLNKIRLTENYKSFKNPLGAKISGYSFRSLEALSNGMAAGKLAVLMQAVFLAQSLKEGIDAPKGDKFKTFAESMASFMAMMLTMGIQLKAFNAAAGMKFIGMKPENYAKYHETIQKINEAGKAGDEAAYKALKAELKNIKSAKVKFWQKPFKWAGNILSWGRIKETIRPLKAVAKPGSTAGSIGAKMKNAMNMSGYGAKMGVSYAGRFLLIATVVMSLFTDTAVKITHKIIGRPKKSILDKEKDETKTKEQEALDLQKQVEAAKAQQVQQPTPPVQNNPNIRYKEGDLLARLKNPNTQPPMQQGYSQQPNQQGAIGAQSLSNPNQPLSKPIGQPIGAQKMNNNEKEEAPEIVRTYVPNPILGPEAEINPSASRNNRIDALMRQADRAEMQAQKFLNGN